MGSKGNLRLIAVDILRSYHVKITATSILGRCLILSVDRWYTEQA